MSEEHEVSNANDASKDTFDDKDKEIERLKKELEQMRKQQEEIMKMLSQMKEKGQPSVKSTSNRSTSRPERVKINVERKAEKLSRKMERSAKTFERSLSDLENVIEDFVTSLLGSIAASIGQGARIVLDVGQSKSRRKKHVDKWREIWKDLSQQEIPDENLEDFLESMAQVGGVLNDKNRIHLLKALEKQPRYHDELSQMTGLKGGQFRHHMTILKENHLVVQERYRGRYILTPFGRSLLKLLEVLYLRYLSPAEDDQELDEDEDGENANGENKVSKNQKYTKIDIEDDDEANDGESL